MPKGSGEGSLNAPTFPAAKASLSVQHGQGGGTPVDGSIVDSEGWCLAATTYPPWTYAYMHAMWVTSGQNRRACNTSHLISGPAVHDTNILKLRFIVLNMGQVFVKK